MVQPMKTLVIDDDVIGRKILVKALESLGHWVIQSGNGRHGWETLWENQDTALVVTDMLMPDMDGGELTRLIRGNSLFEDLPIVIISGVVAESELDNLIKLPKVSFLPKPIDISKFKSSVSGLLS